MNTPADYGHWAAQRELPARAICFNIMLAMAACIPLVLMRLCAVPVSFCYYCAAKKARYYSRQFLDNVGTMNTGARRLSVYTHFLSFAFTMVDKLASWGGRMNLTSVRFHTDGIVPLIEQLEQRKGAFLICSHLGNADMLRAFAALGETRVTRPFKVTSIVDVTVTEQFNATLRRLNPDAELNIISANDIDAGTICALQETVAQGGLVVIAGDRTGAHTKRMVDAPFLGKNARWSEGPFYLAALLAVPVYFVFALRENPIALRPVYDMYVHKSELSFDCGRAERKQRIPQLVHEFTAALEQYCARYPLQWYNFYDFWEEERVQEAV